MSKIKRLKKRFTAFVNQLTPDQVREQLILAYLQMEKCQAVLKGYDVEPETMMNNGESSDLELFYRCKKAAEELACLNQMVHDGKEIALLLNWPYIEDVLVEFEKGFAKQKQNTAFLRFKDELSKISESLRMPKFGKGQEVWYMFGDRVQHSTIVGIVRKVDGVTIYKTKLGHETAECETFGSLEELMENLKKTVNER